MEPEEDQLEEYPETSQEEVSTGDMDAGLARAGTEFSAPPGADAALDEGLRLLDNSQKLIRTIFLGLALQYRSLDLQRSQLLAQAKEAAFCGPQPRAVQAAASLITLCALFGFQKQSQELACAQAGGCPDLLDVKLGAVVILVALIRLIRLTQPEPPPSREKPQAPSQEEETQGLMELAELAEPVI